MRNLIRFTRNNLAFIIAAAWLSIAIYLSFLYYTRVFVDFYSSITPDYSLLKAYLHGAWVQTVTYIIILSVNFIIILIAARWKKIAMLFFLIDSVITIGFAAILYMVYIVWSDRDTGFGGALILYGMIYPIGVTTVLRLPFTALLLKPAYRFKTKMLYLLFSGIVITIFLGNYLIIAQNTTIDPFTKAKTFNYQIFKPSYTPQGSNNYFEGITGQMYYYGWRNESDKLEYNSLSITIEEEKAKVLLKLPKTLSYGAYKKSDIKINGKPAVMWSDYTPDLGSEKVYISWIESGTSIQIHVRGGFTGQTNIKEFVENEAIKIAESMEPITNSR